MDRRKTSLVLVWLFAASIPSVAYATYVVPFKISINGQPAFAGGIDGGFPDRLTDIIRRLADEPLEVRNHFNLDSAAPDGVTLKGGVEVMLLDLPPIRLDRIRLVYDRAPPRNSGEATSGKRYGWRLHRDDALEIITQLESFLTSERYIAWEEDKAKEMIEQRRIRESQERTKAKQLAERRARGVLYGVIIFAICLGATIGIARWKARGTRACNHSQS